MWSVFINCFLKLNAIVSFWLSVVQFISRVFNIRFLTIPAFVVICFAPLTILSRYFISCFAPQVILVVYAAILLLLLSLS